MTAPLKTYIDPDPADIGDNELEFLTWLGGPAEILLSGHDRTRTRAFVTLLHGNEPSGLIALFRWLKSGRRPAVDTLCVVGSVQAAQMSPAFSMRMPPGRRDLNRCFRPPFEDAQGQLASAILDSLQRHRPEAVIDMHNTSGSGPAFAVVTHRDLQHDALASLFTERMLITELKMGALMEISEHLFPTVTIECGGRLDSSAHELAWEGLRRYFSRKDVLATEAADWGLDILHNPVRLELNPGHSLSYVLDSGGQDDGHDLRLPASIEHLNAGVTPRGTLIGWVRKPSPGCLERLLSCYNSRNQSVLNEVLYLEGNELKTRQDLKLFMITTNPAIAMSDCLFYAVSAKGQELSACRY